MYCCLYPPTLLIDYCVKCSITIVHPIQLIYNGTSISLKPSSECVVCEEREKNCICHSDRYKFSPTEGGHVTNSLPPYIPHFLLWLISPTPVKVINKECIKLYDHVEQFISSSAMSKVTADKKSPNKSVNRLPYGLFTLRWQNNSPIQEICLYRCHCFLHYLLIFIMK